MSQITINEEIPLTGRLSPIGGTSSDTSSNENIALLEDHEKLSVSLAALARHVAHVQFRLQQILSAPTTEDRENLLLELHEFASNGIPDIMCQGSMSTNDQFIEAEKSREKEFINDLKQKLDELEHYAAASGSLEGAPTSVTIEKQRVLIDQLREKLDLQIDDESVSKLSAEELRKLVDRAIYQLTNPVKSKENLIKQMHTQIGDLEKFIEFLKADSAKTTTTTTTTTAVPLRTLEPPPIPQSNPTITTAANFGSSPTQSESNSSSLSQTIRKYLILTQLYTFFFLSCGTRSIQKQSTQPTLTKTKEMISKKHFGDLRAQLEMAIEKVLETVRLSHINDKETTTSIETDEEDFMTNPILFSIHQDLAPALRALLEHGLYEIDYPTNLARWGCFSSRSMNKSLPTDQSMHAWKLFLKYYEMKDGYEYANSPARKLSQSFSLNIIGGKPITMKQCLLSGIDTVVKLHEKHAKLMDSCFKSFVCHALNEKKLVLYLRMILKTTVLVEKSYYSWSYTKQTGFNDALHSLDRLTSIDFHLPIDISVRRFLNNQDLIE